MTDRTRIVGLRGSISDPVEGNAAIEDYQGAHEVDNDFNPLLDGDNNGHIRRRLEDANVDYWRQRAGWADDDETMKSYNQGVYNTYYMGDDAAGGGSGGSSGSSKNASKRMLDHMGWILGLASTVVFLVLLVKCCSSAPVERKGRTSSVKSRDSSRSMRDKHGERRSRSRSRAASGRSRSKSRTRTRSKSRSNKSNKDADGGNSAGGGSAGDGYKLMDDGGNDDDNRSKRSARSTKSGKSSRSRSRSKARTRSKSRSGGRSRSKSRSRSDKSGGDSKKSEKKKDKEQKMLV